MGDRGSLADKMWPGWFVVAMLLVWVLGACGAEPETAEPVLPVPTASLQAPAAPTAEPVVSAPEPTVDLAGSLTYQRVELGESGLLLDVPASWQQLAPEWVWSPGEESQARVGVQWADLTPPMEAEAVLLPQNAQVLGAQEVDLAWGRARQIDVEVYAQPAAGGTRAPVESVERHVLVVVIGAGVRRAYDFYAAAPTAEALAPALAVLDHVVASAKASLAADEGSGPSPMPALNTPPATPNVPPQPETEAVQVFFGNTQFDPNAADCGAVYPVERQVPAAAHHLDAALNELFAGPTAAEQAQGYTSWFSLDTANILLDAFVEGDTAYVNVADLRPLIPSASSSCGSAQLLAQMGQTAQAAAPGVTRVLYAIEGSPQLFYEWLQLGCQEMNDFCDPGPFQGQ